MHNTPDDAQLCGSRIAPDTRDFGDTIAFDDHKVAFAVTHCRGKDVLDIGCVQHNPENYRSKYWVHKAIKQVARSLVGLDLYHQGVEFLKARGYDVVTADAQAFSLGKQFDVIFAGDVIEHMDNLGGFLECAKSHLRPEGELLISTPNPWYWRNCIKAAILPEVRANPEHTCWFCPQTLRQLVMRHGMQLRDVRFGSRYLRDRILPLPSGWKHTSFHAVVTGSTQ